MRNKKSANKKDESRPRIKPIKSLGQNFLTDMNIANKIIASAKIQPEDLIIEVGPGTGSLTIGLCKKAGKVVAVEIDKKLIPLLEEKTSDCLNIEIINEDILKLDINKKILDKNPEYKSYKVVANLPYYITTPIMINFLKSIPAPELMVLMMQKEVADRVMAAPGGKEYGSLSVLCQYYCEIERITNVSPGCFFPKPDVKSSVLKMSKRVKHKVKEEEEELFFIIVRSAFAQRRKKISNSISNTSGLNISRERIEQILIEMGLRKDIRAEQLEIVDFIELSAQISRYAN